MVDATRSVLTLSVASCVLVILAMNLILMKGLVSVSMTGDAQKLIIVYYQ